MKRPLLLVLAATGSALAVPDGFEIRTFAEPFDADYPAAIAVAANGDVYVSSDQNGSLGKDKDRGRIIRCRDTDDDGRADEFVPFVPRIDSPRGGHFVGDTLYLVHPPYLSSFRDTDGDGVADEKMTLVRGLGGGIEHPRGADHTTNGVRMGIDGWLYIAVGDFGATPAVGTDGSRYTLHGGGVIRVRPDGTELEPYALMTRNICDVAISPTLDLFSRDNTNDGKGWNTRFHHYTALGDHGYPRLYQHFAEEAIPPLADYGGGSGTGGLWVDEPGFPDQFGHMLYSCDWTTGKVYYHPWKRVGASFEIDQKVFHDVTRATDIDVDGSSRLYIADWRGGSYQYAGTGKKVGLIQQVRVQGGSPARYREVARAADDELVKLIASPSAVQRLEAQREMLKRDRAGEFAHKVYQIAADAKQPIAARVAAIFTCKQLAGKLATPYLAELLEDEAVREHALRAITDRKPELDGVPAGLSRTLLADPDPRVVLQALIGIERQQHREAAGAIIAASRGWQESGVSPRLQHTAATTLASLGDHQALLAGTHDPGTRTLCLRALSRLHEDKAISGLVDMAANADNPEAILEALLTLARLHFKEAPWDGKAWWGTRPDDRGPYFAPVEWEASQRIRAALEQGYARLPEALRGSYLSGLARNRIAISQLQIADLDPVMAALGNPHPTPDQAKVLIDAARDPNQAFPRRFECYRALLRGNPKSLLGQQIEILAAWSQEKALPAAGVQAIDEFINETQRGEQLKPLREIAARGSDAASTLAWKAILTVTTSPLAKERWKNDALHMARDNPKEVGYFNALTALTLPGYEEQIEAGMNWDNKELITAARRAQAATTGGSSAGKRLADLRPDEVTQFALQSAGKGDLAEGKRLYTAQGCVACHAVDPQAVQKGPYLGSAGSKFSREYLIESILDPNAVVAQGFQSTLLTTTDGTTHMGFVVSEADGLIEVRNIAGQASQLKRGNIRSEQTLPQSMMPPGLAAALTLDQFNSLIDYLVTLRSAQ